MKLKGLSSLALLTLCILPLAGMSQLIEIYDKAESDHKMIALQNGYVARVWSVVNDTEGDLEQIWVQSFDQVNTPQTSRILIDEDKVKEPSIAVLTTGTVIITYSAENSGDSGRDGSNWGIMMSQCSADVSSCGSPILVITDEVTGPQTLSLTVAFNDGDFVVGWISQMARLIAQIFDSSLNRVGSEETVATDPMDRFSVCIPNDQTMFFVYKKKNAFEHYIARYTKVWAQVGSTTQVIGESIFLECTGMANGNVAVNRNSLLHGGNVHTTVYDVSNTQVSDTEIHDISSSQYEARNLRFSDNAGVVGFRHFWGSGKWEAYVHYLDEGFVNPGPKKKASRGLAFEDQAINIQLAEFGTGKVGISYTAVISGVKYLAIGNLCRFNSECDPNVTPACGGISCDLCTVDDECDADPALPFCETIAGICKDEELSIEVASSMEDICQTGQVTIVVATNFTNPSFTVIVESSIGDTANEATINTLLSGFNTPGPRAIPITLFQAGATYTFTVFSKRTAQAEVTLVPDELFGFSSASATLNADFDESINIDFNLKNCMGSSLSNSWNQDEGPSFSMAGYTSSNAINSTLTGISLDIPGCVLEPSSTYVFTYEYLLDDTPSVTTEFALTIHTSALSVGISISGAEEIESRSAVELSAVTDFNCPGISNDDMEFMWSCQKKGTEEDDSAYTQCSDPDSLFDFYEAGEVSLLIPSTYYNPEETLSITVSVRYNGEETVSEEHLVSVTSFLDIQLQTLEVERCSLKLILSYDEYEQQYDNNFIWELLSEHSNQEDLQDFLSSVSLPSLVVPYEFIEVGAEYSIQASYVNFKGNLLVETIDLSPIPEIPEVTFDGGSSQTINSHSVNTIKAQTECFPAGLSQKWVFESGPEEIELGEYAVESLPHQIRLPKCLLTPESSYIFSYIVTSNSQETVYEIELTVNSQIIQAQIDGDSGGYHSENEDLDLEVLLITPSNCEIPNKESFTYQWTCSKYDLDSEDTDPCEDPDNIFEDPYDTSELVIPDTYFEKGDNLRLEVTVFDENSDEVASTVSLIEIIDDNVFKLQLSCESDFECIYYSPQVSYFFEINITNRENFRGLQTSWSLSPSFEKVTFINLMKTLQYPSPYFEEESSESQLSLIFQTNNDTHISLFKKLLPINFSPEDGSLTVLPDAGTIMQTQFNIATEGWNDPDLPLKYQYYVAVDIEEEEELEEEEDSEEEEDDDQQSGLSYRPLTQFIKSDSISTLLSTTQLSQSVSNLKIKVVARDAYGASNFATADCTLNVYGLTIEDQINIVEDQLAIVTSIPDPTEKNKQLALLADHITNLEYNITQQGEEQSCTCSDQGNCVDDVCECSEGFTLSECQLTESELSSIVQTKLSILEQLEENIELLTVAEESQELSYLILSEFSKNEEFNSEDSIELIKSMMDELINKDEESVVISVDDASEVSSVLDNIIKYQAKNDCTASSNMTESIEADLKTYMDKISKGLRSNKIPTETPEIITRDTFSVISQIVTDCSIESVEIITEENAPSLSLQSALSEPVCYRTLTLSYFVFQENMFNCDSDDSLLNKTKDIVILQLIDSVNGEDVSSDFEVLVSRSWNDECFDGCSKQQGETESCLCGEESSLFDVEGQIARIFSQKKSDKNEDEWSLHQCAIFWLLILISLLILASYFFIKKKLITYCFVERLKKLVKIKKHQVILGAFLINHPILNCFIIRNMSPNKTSRLLVCYTRLVIMMLIASDLGSNSGLTFNTRRVLSDQGGLSPYVYILLIPFFTFIPAGMLLVKMLAIGEKSKDPQETPKRRKIYKAIKIATYVLIILTILFCAIAIIFIGLSLSKEENLRTLGVFGIALAQDSILTPFIFIILMVIFQKKLINQLSKANKNKNQAAQKPIQIQNKRPKSGQIVPSTLLPEESDSRTQLVKQNSSTKDIVKGRSDENLQADAKTEITPEQKELNLVDNKFTFKQTGTLDKLENMSDENKDKL